MNIQDHIAKINWSLGNKLVIVVFGFVNFFQISMMDTSSFGLWYIILAINQWAMLVSQNFSLQGMIQFGMDKSTRAKADLLSLGLHSFISLLACGLYIIADLLIDFDLGDKVGLFIFVLIASNIFRYFILKFLQREYRYKEYFFVELIYYATISAFIFYRFFTTKVIEVEELVWLFVIAELACSILGLLLIAKDMKLSIKGAPTLKEFINFTVPLALHALAFSVPKKLDVLVARLFFSLSDIGIYSAAKTLFRVFEETGYAAQAILYPASKKGLNANDEQRIVSLLIKGTSAMFVSFAILAIVLNLGLTEFIVSTFLPVKYLSSIGQFNMLVIAALMIPFSSMNVFIMAEGKSKLISKYAIEGAIVFMALISVIGYLNMPNLLPLGYGIFLVYYGIRCYLYIRKTYGYSVKKIFSIIPDSINFIRDKILKR